MGLTRGTPERPDCVFKEGGVCGLHGPGAVLKWRPKKTTTVGADGRKKTSFSDDRHYYYKCDLSQDDRKLKQTRLSFLKTTPGDNKDTFKKGVIENTVQNFSTFTAGQNDDSARGLGTETGHE